MDTFIAAINYLFRTNIKDIKMKNNVKQVRSALWVLGVSAMLCPSVSSHAVCAKNFGTNQSAAVAANVVSSVNRLNATTVEVLLANNQRMLLDFYGDNIFRVFQDNNGGIVRNPEAKPEAQILVNSPRKSLSDLNIGEASGNVTVSTSKISVQIDRGNGLMKVINLSTGATVVEELKAPSFEKNKVTLTLKENSDEYFYGGGVQNGRFSHKGRSIAIENQNSWVDGGVASPTPFYWSTKGYGVMWHTFKKGRYDFGATEKGQVTLSHDTNYLDLFIMVNDGAVALLNDFYQLTGNPVLLPKFGFYEGHLNAYNRDYWKEDEKGILFEDGKRYKESQKNNGGIKESLNGEKGNYQFSARAVIDRYRNHDMPLGWLLPNDGYGAGYGQTETLDGNIQNLKELGDYARKNGVEIGLWTQSDLHPKEGVSALLQRDIVKEVRDAGVRVLKTDVAWVGAGYSFGLNGVADVGEIMPYYGNNGRPFIISLDGWAGTQRYAGVWSGDQTGGVWEYIRFHIPTYIGSGLSGQPNITSDMDGIFGGKNQIVNMRDFQWKTFTPMQLNMDGWGANEKYPHALGEPAASINRMYLKLKSELLPYAYSIAHESVDGKPMIRAMFLDYPNEYTYGKATQYQYLYGPSFLVAPIYEATRSDDKGNDIRNSIYLPEGEWIDYQSGDLYQGNCIVNNFDAPIWKLPVFVKNGAIIPMVNPNNNISEINKELRIYELYPNGKTSFTEYDDDGISEEYKLGRSATTLIESDADAKGKLTVTVHPTEGEFTGLVKEKQTEFRVNVTQRHKKLSVQIGKSKIKLTEVSTLADFEAGDNVYYYNEAPQLNRFATKGSEFENVKIAKNPQVWVKVQKADITSSAVVLNAEGFRYAPADRYLVSTGALSAPSVSIAADDITAYTLKPKWDKVAGADYYEIDFQGMRYTTIRDLSFVLSDLTPVTKYDLKVRAVNKDGASAWTDYSVTTKSDPLEFAIRGIRGECSAETQWGKGIARLFDLNESGEMWHTKYQVRAVPFNVVMDLRTVNQLDKFQYLPRIDGVNGMLLKGKVEYSMDKKTWTEAGTFEWKRNADMKEFKFEGAPEARYIRLSVTEGVGYYGSGREIYVFRKPGTEGYLQGDINADGKIDHNDLTSYMNYTGLRKGDSDYEGYISKGDINRNGLIDAFDISVVATQLDGGVKIQKADTLFSGKVSLSTAKKVYEKGETVNVVVRGADMKGVNALSFALPYNAQDLTFVGVEAKAVKDMENLTYDRLHTNGVKALYPTFVNVGNKPTLEGSEELFVLKFTANRKVRIDLTPADVMLVDKKLNTIDK